jgi:serine/threonine protein kinase
MFEPGATVFNARFRISVPLGRGGITETYLAEQTGLKREVVLKVLAEELGVDTSARERFLEEGRRLASVEHPAVVRVLDAGAAEDRYYLVTERAEGAPLRSALRDGPLLPDRAIELLK